MPSQEGTEDERSAFFDRMESLATAQGDSLETILQRESERALDRSAMTEECLLPDEVERLLALEPVQVRDGRFHIAPDAVLTHAAQAAVGHAKHCGFCQSMLLLLEPRLDARAVFLQKVKLAATTPAVHTDGDRAKRRVQPQEASHQPRFVGATIILVALGLAGLVWPWLQPAQPLRQAGTTFSAYALGAGFAAAAMALLSWKSSGSLRSQVRQRTSQFGAWRPGAVWSGAVGLAVMTVTGFVLPTVTKVVIEHQQSDAVFQAAYRLAGERAAELRCQGDADRSQCALAGALPVPGTVRVDIDASKADVYWDVHGKKLQPMQLELAQVSKSHDGIKQLRLASGATVPFNAASSAEYPVGARVVAVTRATTAQLASLAADSATAPYPLIPSSLRSASK